MRPTPNTLDRAVSFVAGAVTMLHAMRRRDRLLMRACVLGYSAFAVTLLVMLVLAYSAFPRAQKDLEMWSRLVTYYTLIFAIAASAAFLWFAAVCILLWREYIRLAGGVPFDADAPWLHRVGALGVVVLICTAVIALNVWSACSDPEGYLENIG